jgi:hypothetical protein
VPWDDAFEAILRPLLPLLPPQGQIHGDLDMFAAGLGSLTAVELLMTVQDHYGIELADHEVSQRTVESPTALWHTVHRHLTG